ncbi:hypothetical protein O3M35_005294 [Rhynocoris fuscipes]|uniref:Mitotic checkpoint serine/threonine-protein kinase BUB1 n=1 Tax=Rhynocoris fuscipes TaxID=488301 RepID=A0AAW1DNN2_9HEMI
MLKMEKNEIYRRHQALEQEISVYIGDDPLKLRYDFISWLDGNYGRENVMETFVPVLEDTLKSFWNAVQYQQDVRFIQLLTTYINMQKNPLEMYKSVYDRGTGTESALFYTSWANAFVEKENYKKADEIYNLGLSKVKSKTELKSAYENFLVSLGKKYLHLSKNNLWETMCPKCCENQKSESAQGPPQTSCDQNVGYYLNPLKVGEKDDFKCPMFVEDPPDPSKISMYPKHLVYRDGKEYSLEEVRASILREKYKNKESENSKVLRHTANDASEKMTVQDSEDNSNEKEFCKENINQENNILQSEEEPLKCHTTPPKHPLFPKPLLLQDSLTVSQTSYTAHMKEAMNVVQEMWSSPSPAVVPPVTNLHPRGRSLFGGTTDTAKEAPITDENVVASVPKKTPFSVYTEEEEEQQQPKNYLPTPTGAAKTGIQKAKTSVKKDPLQLKDHAKGLNVLSERKPKGNSDVHELIKRPSLLPNVKQQLPFSNVPQVEDNQNEMLAMKLGDVSISSNNQPPRITNVVKPILPHDQDDFTDVTCNTKAFNFSLPSSTPIQNKKFSGTRNSTDMQSSEPPSHLKSTKNPDLSMILEASKERYSSSSSSNNGIKGQSTVPPVLTGKNVNSIPLARRLKKGESKIMDNSGKNYEQLNQNLLMNRSLKDKELNTERSRIFNERYNLDRKHSLQCPLTGTIHKKNHTKVDEDIIVENLKNPFEKCCNLDISINKESINNVEKVGKPTLNESFSNSSKRILQESNLNYQNFKNDTNDRRIYRVNKDNSLSVDERNLGKEITQSNQSQRRHSTRRTRSSTLLSDKSYQIEDKLVKTKHREKVNETEPLESENKENSNSCRSFRKKRSQSIQTREVNFLKLNKKSDIKGQISGGNLRKRTKSLLNLKPNSIDYTKASEELSSKQENKVKTKKKNRSSSEPALVFTNDRTNTNLKIVDKNGNISSSVNNITEKDNNVTSANVSCNKTNSSSRRGRKKSVKENIDQLNEVRIIKRRSERLFERNKKLQEICFKSSAEQDIDPFCPKLQAKLLRSVNFPQSYHSENYFVINSSFPTMAKTLKLGNETYNILGDIGKGAYARVVKASVKNRICALKVEKPACKWEHYICREIQKRVPPSVKSLFMDVKNTFIFNGGSILESDWAQYGNLLNITNQYKIATGKVLDSSIVLHFSIELVQIIDFLHQCQIIHADIKPDNFVVRSLPSCNETQGCIQLIDFGRSIDMRLLPAGTQFTTVVKTEGFTCCEMRERKPWTYQTDLYGLAATMHCLIFNEYMVIEKKNNEWKLNKPLPRNFRKLWEPIFLSLLNVESSEKLPSLIVLKSMLEDALNSKDKYVLSQNYRSLENILKGK